MTLTRTILNSLMALTLASCAVTQVPENLTAVRGMHPWEIRETFKGLRAFAPGEREKKNLLEQIYGIKLRKLREVGRRPESHPLPQDIWFWEMKDRAGEHWVLAMGLSAKLGTDALVVAFDDRMIMRDKWLTGHHAPYIPINASR